jgi:YfiR/HmsC-like
VNTTRPTNRRRQVGIPGFLGLRSFVPACFGLTIAACVLFAVPSIRAQQSKLPEYEVKAAYLYNFGKFVEWPATANAGKDNSFTICVLGQDPFGPALDAALAGQSIDGKNVVARRLSKAQEAVNCRIVFISSSEESRLKDVLEALDKAAVLTVSDIPQFSTRGGAIQFVLDGKKIRFEVNLSNAAEAGLTLSSELLKVATTVRKNSPSGD